MNKGKYVFSQIMTDFHRWIIEDSVKNYKGDFHAKNLNSYSHCLHLMFGQLAGFLLFLTVPTISWCIIPIAVVSVIATLTAIQERNNISTGYEII